MKARKINMPAGTLVGKFLPADYTDSFICQLTEGDNRSADDIMVAFWTDTPRWIKWLMRLRNILVRPFGLRSDGADAEELENCIRTGGSCRLASVPAKSPEETVLLLSDKHLNAYMSVRISGSGMDRSVSATTLVVFNNRLGPIYFCAIRPFHSVIVRKMLKRIAKTGTVK